MGSVNGSNSDNPEARVSKAAEIFDLDLHRLDELIREDIANSQSSENDFNNVNTGDSLMSICALIKADQLDPFIKAMTFRNLSVTDAIGAHLQLTPLHWAAYFQSLKILSYCLRLPQTFVNYPDREMNCPLNLGLIGAQSDTCAVEITRLFCTHKDVNVFRKNQNNIFPLLIAVTKKFGEASKLLLRGPSTSTSFQKNKNEIISNKYEARDLIEVLKVALSSGQDNLAGFINQNLNASRRVEMRDEIEKRSQVNSSDLMNDLVSLLEQTVVLTSTTKPKPKPANKETIVKATPDSKYLPTTEDASGKTLKIGNVIKTLSALNVQRALPPRATPSIALKLAEKLGTIHDISGNQLYVEIHGEQCVARLKAEAVVLVSQGASKVIGGGHIGRIGSFVKVLLCQEEVRDFVGEGGWVHGMEEACGKTGRIVRIFKETDVLVQFAWGPRFYFKPEALLQSCSDNIMTQDCNRKWIRSGSLVQLKTSLQEFRKLQKKNQLPYEGSYTSLPLSFAEVKEIQIKAFSSSKTVQITYRKSLFFVSAESIELVDWIRDGLGNELSIGDEVQIMGNPVELKILDNFDDSIPVLSSWVEVLEERPGPGILGQLGVVVEFCSDATSRAVKVKAAIVKVEFPDLTWSYFSPGSVEIYTVTVLSSQSGGSGFGSGSGPGSGQSSNAVKHPTIHDTDDSGDENVHWEEIERRNLINGDFLGQGGMGCVTRGKWVKNGRTQTVAIKQIKDNLANATGQFTNFLLEAKIQFSLKHPNVLSLLGISFVEDRDLWIVMDLIDGTDLYTMLFSSDHSLNSIPLSKKLSICLDMCNAVSYMHQKGYLHGDIKPQNMMVDKNGKLFVCDFGITRFLGNMDVVTFATEYTNNLYGTLYYIPPECVQVNERTGQYRKPKYPADVWALGAIFYEMFTHLHLYDQQMKFLQHKMANKDSIVKERVREIPIVAISPIVGRSLDFDRHARPSAQELSEFFYELLRNPSKH